MRKLTYFFVLFLLFCCSQTLFASSKIIAESHPQLRIIVATGRNYLYQALTERQLIENSFLTQNQTLLFQTTGLKNSQGNTSIKGTFGDNPQKPMAYLNGILYSNFNKKGPVLDVLLKLLNQAASIQAIVFVDDESNNINAVYNFYQATTSPMVTCVHYSKENQKAADFLTNVTRQQKSYENWLGLRNAFKKYIVSPDLPN